MDQADKEALEAGIVALWMGKAVRQASGIEAYVGRTGNVAEAFWDEKGALHLLAAAPEGAFWCPAALLTTDFLEAHHCQSVSPSGEQCTRPKDHAGSLRHYARGDFWDGDFAETRALKRPGEPRIVRAAPVGAFMRADNPLLGGGWGL